jgi:predicted ATP-binding protein involved in virulence
MDLIWRASQLNPWLTLEQLSEQQTGCVTIDEIDLHLHPKWQAKTIGILQELLPNVQFFITTHSPMVVANFK